MKKTNLKLFKNALSKFATGVTVVTINKNSKFIGKTVNSFTSLSLKPPMVLFSLDKKSTSLKDYCKTKYLGINILARDQKHLSSHFSKTKPNWKNIDFFLSNNKIPMINKCLVNISCKNIENIKQGDHIIFICKVIDININNKVPLIYINSKYI